jgi:RNA polymerase sigma-70 factor (ECF subfamily)
VYAVQSGNVKPRIQTEPVGDEAAPIAPEQVTEELAAERLERARRGDMDAWARLYQDHFEYLLRHLAYLTGDVSLAEDLVQESFANAFAGLSRFQGRSSFSTWLCGIANNVARQHFRRSARRDRAFARIKAGQIPTGEPEEAALKAGRLSDFRAALDTLPPKLSECYLLLDVAQLTPAEVGKRLSISPGNASVRAARARSRLRETMARLGWIEPKTTGGET